MAEIDERFYEIADNEFETARNNALWVKCLTLCTGDERRARFEYTQRRAERLSQEQAGPLTEQEQTSSVTKPIAASDTRPKQDPVLITAGQRYILKNSLEYDTLKKSYASIGRNYYTNFDTWLSEKGIVATASFSSAVREGIASVIGGNSSTKRRSQEHRMRQIEKSAPQAPSQLGPATVSQQNSARENAVLHLGPRPSSADALPARSDFGRAEMKRTRRLLLIAALCSGIVHWIVVITISVLSGAKGNPYYAAMMVSYAYLQGVTVTSDAALTRYVQMNPGAFKYAFFMMPTFGAILMFIFFTMLGGLRRK